MNSFHEEIICGHGFQGYSPWLTGLVNKLPVGRKTGRKQDHLGDWKLYQQKILKMGLLFETLKTGKKKKKGNHDAV